jgi:hypothetical protein
VITRLADAGYAPPVEAKGAAEPSRDPRAEMEPSSIIAAQSELGVPVGR